MNGHKLTCVQWHRTLVTVSSKPQETVLNVPFIECLLCAPHFKVPLYRFSHYESPVILDLGQSTMDSRMYSIFFDRTND